MFIAGYKNKTITQKTMVSFYKVICETQEQISSRCFNLHDFKMNVFSDLVSTKYTKTKTSFLDYE